MKTRLLTISAHFGILVAQAQVPPPIQWERTFGGSENDVSHMIALTADGGYVMVGSSTSVGEQVETNEGLNDIWVLRMDGEGEMVWNRTFGGSGEDMARAVRVAADGSILLLASTTSEDGPFGDPISPEDMVLGQLTASGEMLSFHRLGHVTSNQPSDLLLLGDGDDDRIVLGTTVIEEPGLPPQVDVLLYRVSSNGNIVWERTFGGSEYESSFSLAQYPNGDLMVTATTRSNDGDVTGQMGLGDGWLLRVDLDGDLIEQRTFGTQYDDQTTRALPTADGGVIITGYFSYLMDELPNSRVVAIKMDADGDIEWTRDYGGTSGDYGWYVQQVEDGGYLLFAHAYSDDGDVTDFHGSIDAWLLRLNASGDLLWDRCFGGWDQESPTDIKVTPDGGVILIVATLSPNPEMTTYLGGLDTWVIKLEPEVVGIAERAEAPFRIVADDNGHGATIHTGMAGGFVEVSTTTGQSIRHQRMTGSTLHIDLGPDPAGVYFITLIRDQRKYTLPFARN